MAVTAALLTLAVLVSLTIAGWYMVEEMESRSATTRFEARLQQLTTQLRSRLLGYEKILRGGVGFLRASGHVTRAEWRTFVESLRLELDYPGIQGVGLALTIAPEDLPAHVAAVRAEGFPHYRVWPEGPRDEYTSIVYLEPFRDRNLRAFGYDMFSEPVRNEAMRRARDTGDAAMTRKVTLVQETGENVQAGFLMYLPYYGEDLQPVDAAERRAALLGYVYAPFRMNDLVDAVNETGYLEMDVAIFDGTVPDASNLLFSTGPVLADGRVDLSRFATRTSLELYGVTWSILAAPRPGTGMHSEAQRAPIVLGGGLLASLLLSAIVWSLIVSRHRANALAEANRNLQAEIAERVAATAALAQAKQRYQQVVESITDAFYTLDTEWRFTYVSPRAERLLRHTSAELLGRIVWQVFPEAVGTPIEREIRRAVDQCVEVQFVEYYPPLATWFDIQVYPHVGGLSIFFRDVTSNKRSEEALRLRERAVESTVNAIVITDPNQPDDPIIYVNPAFERITGYSAAEAIGRNCRFLQREDRDQPDLEKVRTLLREGREGQVVLRNYRKNGELFWNELHLSPVRDDSGRITHFVGIQNDITEARTYQQQLEHQATHDALTGLPNRALLRDRIAQAVAHANRARSSVAVVFMDLDNFKLVNDSLGHGAGDEALRLMAQRLTAGVRRDDTVARLGGDEFVILLSNNGSIDEIAAIADKLLHAASRPMRINGQEIVLTCSAGISVCPDDGSDPDALLKNADLAMYKAKESGRNFRQFYAPEMNEKVVERLELVNNLRQALGREEFVLHYQPQFDLESGALVGFEALLRWQHPERGLVGPAEFIPLAEETGIIVPIGEWVIRSACAFYESLRRLSLPPLILSVNLSARQLRHQSLVSIVRSALEESSLPPELLELEVTESMLMHDIDEVLGILAQLKSTGVRIAMDDFGTGYSSLAYLQRLPIDRLKIDKSFVRDVTSDLGGAAIAKAIVSLAHTIGLKVVAEGIETPEQLRALKEFECDEGQGYHFAKPMPGPELVRMIQGLQAGAETQSLVAERSAKRQNESGV